LLFSFAAALCILSGRLRAALDSVLQPSCQADGYPYDAQGPRVHSGDFLPQGEGEEEGGADRAKGGIRTRMQHYFQKQKNTAPALHATTS